MCNEQEVCLDFRVTYLVRLRSKYSLVNILKIDIVHIQKFFSSFKQASPEIYSGGQIDPIPSPL